MSSRPLIPDAVFQSFEEKSDPAQVAPRIAALRAHLNGQNLDGFIVPRADVHQGEYVPESDARLAYISGFTGSAGLAVIGAETAGLFVDSRYTLQAPAQTDTAIFTVIDTTFTSPGAWIAQNFPKGTRLGFDAWLLTPGMLDSLKAPLDKAGITLEPVENPIDALWQDRPAPPQGPIETLGHNRAGQSADDKLADLRKTMRDEGAEATVFTLPESLCWLFNIRGRDVPHNLPSSASPSSGRGRTHDIRARNKLTDETARRWQISPPCAKGRIRAALKELATAGKSVWFDPATARARAHDPFRWRRETHRKRDPVLLPKAKKNEVELAGMREAHKLDGVAMARFLAWLDREAPRGHLTEIDIVKQLEAFRRDEPTAVDVSFETISGSGPNGAVVHYRVSEKTNRRLNPGELMLVDSGGQYLSGTTDITSHHGHRPVTDEQKDRFTRVLKGMIAISRARFPRGTSGAQLDVLARQYLWQVGLTYNHGTGHGVGAFLSVHEGPAGISPRYTVPFEEGMVLSNSPVITAKANTASASKTCSSCQSEVDEGFLEFETLTLAPIDKRLIDVSLLESDERNWLNTYHTPRPHEIAPGSAARTGNGWKRQRRSWTEQQSLTTM